jgi:hypothetical protein
MRAGCTGAVNTSANNMTSDAVPAPHTEASNDNPE